VFGAKEGGVGWASGVGTITAARGNMANITPSTQEKISRYPALLLDVLIYNTHSLNYIT
jgi:hypothetical protein